MPNQVHGKKYRAAEKNRDIAVMYQPRQALEIVKKVIDDAGFAKRLRDRLDAELSKARPVDLAALARRGVGEQTAGLHGLDDVGAVFDAARRQAGWLPGQEL